MKGVTRVTASLLAAAMTAGLGTTAVFADAGNTTGGTVGDVVEETKPEGTATSYVELYDANNNIIGSTDAHQKEYYNMQTGEVDKLDAGAAKTTVDVYMAVGGTKTLKAALDAKSTHAVKWNYEDVNGDGKVTKDDLAAGTQTPELDVVGLDNGVLTAKKVGTVKVFAYADDATKTTTDVDTDNDGKNDSKKTLITGNIIEVDVHVEAVESVSTKFEARDSIYTTEFDNEDFSGYTKLSDFTAHDPQTAHDAVDLHFNGSQYVHHVATGDTLATDTTVTLEDGNKDVSDSNSNVSYVTDSRRYVSYSANTVTVVGDAPNKGFGLVHVEYKDADQTVESNYLAVLGHTGVAIYRIYNPNTGEHLYTKDANEVKVNVELGWVDEGIGWYAPEESSTKVTRMFNANNGGEHVYTTDAKEIKFLETHGWVNEGSKFYDASSKWYPLYRQYNPNQIANNHNYTGNIAERTALVSLGWKDEGVKLHALELSEDTIKKASDKAEKAK